MIFKSISNQFHPDYENNSKHCSDSNIFKHKAKCNDEIFWCTHHVKIFDFCSGKNCWINYIFQNNKIIMRNFLTSDFESMLKTLELLNGYPRHSIQVSKFVAIQHRYTSYSLNPMTRQNPQIRSPQFARMYQ